MEPIGARTLVRPPIGFDNSPASTILLPTISLSCIPMTAFRQKLQPHALIPWVLALVALFGCNLLAQQKASLRKSAHLDSGSVTQLADESLPSSATTNPLLGLTSGSSNSISLTEPAAQRLAIDPRWEKAEITRRSGTVQGRAPPTSASC